MKIPAISNLINASNALASGAALNANASAASNEMQFKQILSRGIEERRAQPEPSKPVEKESAPAKQAQQTAQPSPSAQSAAKTNKNQSAESKTASADQESAAPAGEGTTAKVEHGKNGSDAAKDSDDDQAALAASSDELLALVAGLTQAAAPAASKETPADDAAQTAPVDADAAAAAAAAAVAALGATATALAPAVAALSANAAALAPAVGLSATDLAKTVAKGNKGDITDQTAAQTDTGTTAQTALTDLGDRRAADAARTEEPGTADKFGAELGQATDRRRTTDTDAAAAQPQVGEKALPAATEPRPEPRTAKPAVDLQPSVMTVAAMNIAPHAQASLQQTQAAADRLTPRVGSSGWDQALGQKVVWMVSGEIQSASLTLNPPDLGPLEVVLNVSNNQADVSFTAAQPEVRQALQDAVPKLKEMLGDAGIQLGQANVSAGTPNNHGSQSGDQRHGSGGAGRPMDEGVEDPVRPQRGQAITAGSEGLVDTFA